MFGIKNRRKRSKKRDYSRLLSINLSRVDIVLMLLILLCMDKDMGGRAAIHCRATDIALSRSNPAGADIVLSSIWGLAATLTSQTRGDSLEV